MRVAGLILAGGASRRMGGGDKPLLLLRGVPMIEHVRRRLAPQVDALAISANGDPARFAAFGLPVLADAVTGRGPLEGVLAGMAWAATRGATKLVTVPGDTPFIPRNLVCRLGEAPAVAGHGGRVHHLVALWPVSLRTELAAWLDHAAVARVSGWTAGIGMRVVTFGGEADPFTNINTPDELLSAQARCGPDLSCA
jgi:molybdenum cofactor guanylyltransferase